MKKPQVLQEKIAVLLIGGAFILIGGILAIHFYATFVVTSQISNITNASQKIELFRELDNSNLNLFSILFSLFGAWIGAVLAFYFGSQSLERAYSSLSQAQSSIDRIVSDNKLAGIKVNEIVAKNPDCRNLLKFKLSDKVEKIVKDAEERNYSFVMITDDSGKEVIGLLFISDLSAIKSKADLLQLQETLQEFITKNDIKDAIKKQKWTIQGVKNFVTASMDDSLKTLVDKMKQLDDSLSVRAVVIENGVPIATITYDMISKEVKR